MLVDQILLERLASELDLVFIKLHGFDCQGSIVIRNQPFFLIGLHLGANFLKVSAQQQVVKLLELFRVQVPCIVFWWLNGIYNSLGWIEILENEPSILKNLFGPENISFSLIMESPGANRQVLINLLILFLSECACNVWIQIELLLLQPWLLILWFYLNCLWCSWKPLIRILMLNMNWSTHVESISKVSIYLFLFITWLHERRLCCLLYFPLACDQNWRSLSWLIDLPNLPVRERRVLS